jgi:hypothetical protein
MLLPDRDKKKMAKQEAKVTETVWDKVNNT